VAPAADIEFVGQLMQTPAVEAPETTEYLPASQSEQLSAAPAPAVVEYLPAIQLVQLAADTAPSAVEYLPAGQSKHERASLTSTYFPAGHSEHCCEIENLVESCVIVTPLGQLSNHPVFWCKSQWVLVLMKLCIK
jgi:hypothetical protein